MWLYDCNVTQWDLAVNWCGMSASCRPPLLRHDSENIISNLTCGQHKCWGLRQFESVKEENPRRCWAIRSPCLSTIGVITQNTFQKYQSMSVCFHQSGKKRLYLVVGGGIAWHIQIKHEVMYFRHLSLFYIFKIRYFAVFVLLNQIPL